MPLIPCREPVPNLPKKKRTRPPAVVFGNHELFGFDTETTRCGKKELRSYQAVWDDNGGNRYGLLIYLDGWFAAQRMASLDASLRNTQPNYVGLLSKNVQPSKSYGKLRNAHMKN